MALRPAVAAGLRRFMALSLTTDLLTHNDIIDRQHMVLFERINMVISMHEKAAVRCETEKTLDLLGAYIKKHFSDEEELMRQCGYKYIDWHMEMHRWYIAEFCKLRKEYIDKGPSEQYHKLLENSIINWIVKHILNVDVSLGKYINECKLRNS